ncbi:GDP-L-fucose synthetase [Prochlorococcus marinus str. MIT 9201]|uniref:GDP-L-fucose synthase n=1 Tax=Prochlorococcus marinus str. MIT 9201 TaxID=93057 RepID=A0A0A2A4Z9_PROMR|nr:GDP-L-fucose synthase [Prochlorococcus marinus]KGF96680.1 GDP-L-fucose synthetase [Prochlorococcus marinus str. MIT 9201]
MKKGIQERDRILITGANGMVGSAISRLFENNKFKDNYPKVTILKPSRKELDLSDANMVLNWFANNKPDIVVNAAAKVGGILANSESPSDFLLDNLKIQNNLIETSYKLGVRRFLFLGSSCIYPKFSKQPIKEEYLLSNSLEETNQWYALAKIAGIKLCDAFRYQYGFDAISLMPTNLYGQNDNYNPNNSHVLPALISKFYYAKTNSIKEVTCWGTGKPLREFLYVDDLAKAVIFALDNWFPEENDAPKDSKGNKLTWLNVGTKDEIKIKNLAEIIAKKLDYKGRIIWDINKPDGTPRKKLDSTKFLNLGWSPKYDLEKGIERTISCFKEELKNKSLRT